MFCKNCGRQIPDNAAFCPGCGSKRSGGDAYGDGRSSANIKDLPSYAKENDLNRSGFAIDTNREKFDLSGQKKFSLSGQSKFSLSGDSGKNKFSLSDKSGKDSGDGIVRISSGKKPEEPPKEPTGFVNPLKDSGKTVFRSDSANDNANKTPIVSIRSEPKSEQENSQAGFNRPEQNTAYGNPPENSPDIGGVPPGGDSAEPTGFVNPLKDSGQDIHWGSDGDRNTTPGGNFGEIDSHMGFAIVMTVLGCCDCISLILGIAAIVYASKVSAYVQSGNYEEAKKCSDNALLLCWISLGIKILCWIGGFISQLLGLVIS